MDFNFEIIVLDEKSLEDIFIYYFRYKIPCISYTSCIIFCKMNGYIKCHNGSKYLTSKYPTDGKNKNMWRNMKKCFIKLLVLFKKIKMNEKEEKVK